MRRLTAYHEHRREEVGCVGVDSDDGLRSHVHHDVLSRARRTRPRVGTAGARPPAGEFVERGVSDPTGGAEAEGVTDAFGDASLRPVLPFARHHRLIYGGVVGRLPVLCAVALLALTACGSGGKSSSQTATVTTAASSPKQCRNQAAALVRIDRDLTAMQRATTAAAMSTLTDSFLLHVSTAPLTNLQRNRLIDHAAAAVSIKCPQYFQALEAERPIPAIRAGELKCSS